MYDVWSSSEFEFNPRETIIGDVNTKDIMNLGYSSDDIQSVIYNFEGNRWASKLKHYD